MWDVSGGEASAVAALIFRAGGRSCALPVSSVIETMRPLAVQEVAGAPAAVLGIAVIRGVPTVVVDASRLLGADRVAPERFVTVRLGARSIALAVDAVIGVRTLSSAQLHGLPPLLSGAVSIDALGTVDADLVVMLRAAYLIPEDVLRELDAELKIG